MAQNTFERNSALSEWLKAASKEHKELLYSFSHKSADAVSQWASGRRNMSAGNAGEVALGTFLVKHVTRNAPAPLTRGDLCAACKQCPHFKESQNTQGG